MILVAEQAQLYGVQVLPQAATQDEVNAAVDAAVAETGASSMKDMGTLMKATMARLAGKNADGKMVSEAVKARLGYDICPRNTLKARKE